MLAAGLSVLFMGLGQLYNKQYLKGLTFLLLELYLLIFWTVPFQWAMWGLTTLGETVQTRQGFEIIQGDHSIFLMIEGILFLISFLLFLWFYYLNIRDAYKVAAKAEKGIKPNNAKQMLKNIWDNGFPYILLTPSILFTAFLTILPLLFGVLIAFTNYSAPNHLPPKALVDWVGFDTFVQLFKMKTWSATFYGVFSWTVIWAVLATITTYFLGLVFAVLISQKGIKLKKFWRSIFILPWAIPQFVSILIFRNIFNGEFGPINKYLMDWGITDQAIHWLSDPILAKLTLVIVNMWFGFPFWMVLMSGVMTSVDKEIYEAAEVDGASSVQKFWKITMPLIMFSTAPLAIMSFANNFNNFNIIYLMTQGGPVNTDYSYAGSTDILISWIYKLTLDNSQFAVASVVSILIFIIIAIFSIYNFRKTRAFKEEDMMS
ncbi:MULTISPECIES: sugar ABC transporter permease [Bacillaceae]|uniref:carbohydrate ABC transporter permease n=1 Tax=Bacillaceae TaxID=186817 RepID=UPI001E2B0184|nr:MULTISPECIES: sugar ABC transporter permease [Bacillaceae]MCE4049964.1 sugar ABC transporter permease [Bacillus sp. Au-Bac7]MDL0436899.1 sugar ABC transporter permease [Niallia sp. SS-2023]UPO89451.1 sugar ABC transporter permease [Niallia sp. Man26]